MGFKKGNTYGKGRPVGSQNKLSKANREFLHHILFDQEQFIQDWISLDLNGRMELRTRLAPYILPKAGTEESYIELKEPPLKSVYEKFGLEAPDEPDDYFSFDQLMKDLRKQNETTTIQRDGLPSNEQR